MPTRDDREAQVLGEQVEPEVGEHERRGEQQRSADRERVGHGAERRAAAPGAAARRGGDQSGASRCHARPSVRRTNEALRAELQEGDDQRRTRAPWPRLASVQYSMKRVEHAERERRDHRAAQLAEAAEHHDHEGVDDVVGAERRADRADQRQRARRRRRPGRSRGRTCAGRPGGWRRRGTRRSRGSASRRASAGPCGERCQVEPDRGHAATTRRDDEQPLVGQLTPAEDREPPSASRARRPARSARRRCRGPACWSIRLTPQVASSVSSGRP